MKLYLMTRGTERDYVFLGPIPERQWWDTLSDGNLLFTTEFSLAVEGRGATWSLALFGVPSARRDIKGRPIRYTVIVEAGPQAAESAVRLVRLALSEPARTGLGASLDEIYPKDLVDGVLEKLDGFSAPPVQQVIAILDEFAAKQPGVAPPEAATAPPWVGPSAEQESVDAFVAYVWRLACGAEGVGISGRGYETVEEARRALAVVESDVAVLAADAGFTALQSLKKDRTPEPLDVPVRPKDTTETRPEPTAPRRRIPVKALALGGSGLIIALLILWLLRKL